MDLFGVILRENERTRDYIVRLCQDLTDEQICYANDNVDERWIGNIACHLYPHVSTQVSKALGEPPKEFTPPKTTAGVLQFAEATHAMVQADMKRLTAAQLDQ